ncbi:hypothetical protein KUCAC02_029574 [Chaenocephalus aceratus]|nr:hypothetical protein KUCAC02_029574 [Chaenocephalus aceratus]
MCSEKEDECQSLSRVSLPCHFLLNNFMAAVPDHHCHILDDGGLFGNLTQEQKLSLGIPAENGRDPELLPDVYKTQI